jgi:hypothetical protein
MAQDMWTDPRGTQRPYSTQGGGLRGGVRNALERQRTWRGVDPSFDTQKYQVGPTGQISEVGPAFDWKLAAGVLAAPVAAAYAPALFGAGGTAGTAASAAPAAAGAGTAAGGAAAAGGGIWNTISRFAANPLVQQGVQAAGQYLTGRTNANASRDAANAQLQGVREALDFEKGVYADDQRFFEPYAQVGQQSVARLSDLVRQPPPAPVTAESLMASGRLPSPNAGRRPRMSDLVRY